MMNLIRSKIYIIPALIMMLAMGLGSCADELEMPLPDTPDAQSGYISLKVECSEMTRATEPGVDGLNENRIDRVTLCLWPNGGDWNTDRAPLYMETFTGLDAVGTATLRVPLTDGMVSSLFQQDGSNTCRAFVAVNVDPGTAKTVDELRALAIGSRFANTLRQDYFAMDGEGNVQLAQMGGATGAYGTIDVKRSASKIDLHLNVTQEVEETVGGQTLTWRPDLSAMSVRLSNGVAASKLDPTPKEGVPDADYFSTAEELTYSFTTEGSDAASSATYPHRQSIPFYTYPNVWTANPDEAHRTYMTLMVPWTSDGGASYRTCYYQVPVVPLDRYELVRNTSYHVRLNVSVLGSFVPDEPLELEEELSYVAADWGTEGIEVDIKDFRYLVVDQNDYIVNNQNHIEIPFYTSHNTQVIASKMTFYRYNFSDQGAEFAVTVTDTENNESERRTGSKVFTCVFDNNTNKLLVSHDLVVYEPMNSGGSPVSLTQNDGNTVEKRPISVPTAADYQRVLNQISYYRKYTNASGVTEDEYSRVEFEITVQHTDQYGKDVWKETVRISQYPGMFITAVANNSDLLGIRWSSGAMGNTIINTRYDDTTYSMPAATSNWGSERKLAYNYRNWDYSLGLSSGYLNWNPNMYLITITALPEGTPYVIGDPRSSNINLDLSNNHGNYTVDGGSTQVFRTEYWYYQKGNNNLGPETNTGFFGGGSNPFYRHYGVSTLYWDEYIINGFQNARAIEGGTRTLRYYYPTKEVTANQNTIAPKFRLCSSYGGSSAYMTREMSRRRAAAYQELGYMAGRWRLPTFAEVKFVMDLAADFKIPRLFGCYNAQTWYYWCAQGAVRVPGKTNRNPPSISIVANPTGGATTAVSPFTGDNYRDHTRFVYDEWYWGSELLTPSSPTPNETTPTYTFTWGDKPRSNPQD